MVGRGGTKQLVSRGSGVDRIFYRHAHIASANIRKKLAGACAHKCMHTSTKHGVQVYLVSCIKMTYAHEQLLSCSVLTVRKLSCSCRLGKEKDADRNFKVLFFVTYTT